MRIDIVKNKIELGRAAAKFVAGAAAKKPHLVLGLPSGTTPLLMYRDLLRLHRKGLFDASKITTFNLDEYYGLAPDNKHSYAHLMDRMFLRFLPVFQSHIPSGLIAREKVAAYCRSYEGLIASGGGLDLTVLGIGTDGHIGFNMPGSPFDSRTRLVTLSWQTRKDNARFFRSIKDVPTQAITMGIATIMSSRTILLLASGKGKADILLRALEGPVAEEVPASIIQKHKNAIIIADEGAAHKLSKK